MFHYGIVIPCYNEASRLPVEEFIDFYSRNPDISFCFVNDGSRDNTLSVLNELIKGREDRMMVFNRQPNKGKAEAVRAGILETIKWKSFDYVGYFDADLATPLSEINTFKKYISEHPVYEFFMGSRIQRMGANIERKTFRHYVGRVFATQSSMLLGLPVYDTQCGAKLIKTELAAAIFKEPFISKWLFDVELLFRIIKLYGRKEAEKIIYEIPLNVWLEKKESKIKILDFFKVPFELLMIRSKYQ